MYIDDKFLELYEEYIQNGVINLILNEDEIFLMKLNYKYIKENKDEDLSIRTKKLSEKYQKGGYSNKRVQRANICSIFSKIGRKINTYVELYGKNTLLSISRFHKLNGADLLNQDITIKFIIDSNIKVDEEAMLFSIIENKRKQVIIFGNDIPFIPLEQIGLSKIYLTALRRANVTTVADVCERINSYSYFKNVHNFGEKGFDELVRCIHDNGFLFVNEANHLCDEEEMRYRIK